MKSILYKFSKLFFYGFVLFAIVLTFGALCAALEHNDLVEFSFISFQQNEVLMFRFFIVQVLYGAVLFFIIMALCFYCFYFYILKNFFQLFTEEKVFSEKNIQNLKYFQKLNYIPAIVFLGRGLYPLINQNKIDGELVIIAIFHLLLALILWYFLELFKKGFYIQTENDLTI